ncbi:MAG TPA: four helix bundle protein [Opitutaceae bacterium]|jgi:four helix bundle protein|nr:four helix bundle protein [Opitutaceae bacterium]
MNLPTKTVEKRKFDLEERLLDFSVRIIRLAEKMPKTVAGRHVGGQVLRSGTSPYGNHGEAEDAESSDDFIHKLKICLKELRESWRWLRLIQRVPMVPKPDLMNPLIQESDELIRIFRTSIATARRNKEKRGET